MGCCCCCQRPANQDLAPGPGLYPKPGFADPRTDPAFKEGEGEGLPRMCMFHCVFISFITSSSKEEIVH